MIHYHLYIIISQLLQMKTIIIYDHLRIVNFLDFPLSSIIINNQHYLFSMCDHHQTSIIIYYHLLSSTNDHPWLSIIIHSLWSFTFNMEVFYNVFHRQVAFVTSSTANCTIARRHPAICRREEAQAQAPGWMLTTKKWAVQELDPAFLWLVGGFNHLEKYEFVNGKDYPI